MHVSMLGLLRLPVLWLTVVIAATLSTAQAAAAEPAAAERASAPVVERGSATRRLVADRAFTAVLVRVRLRGCRAGRVLAVVLDGRDRARVRVPRRRGAQRVAVRLSGGAGRHLLRVAVRGCRSVRLHRIRVVPAPARPAPAQPSPEPAPPAPARRPTPPPAAAGNPLAGRTWWVDPNGNAARTAAQWRAEGRTADADALDLVAAQPQAAWFGPWYADVEAAVRAYLDRAGAAGATQGLLVAYNEPVRRRCSAQSAEEYATWIRSFARGIGDREAVVVLEPDGIPLLDAECPAPADRERQLGMLADAVGVLSGLSRTAVYLDAGHANWVPAAETARRLRGAGLARTRGISLNVSNYGWTADQAAFGRSVLELAEASPDQGIVVDTARNGRGPSPDATWCNAPDRGLGHAPTADTGQPRVHALLWIKPPGESDGDWEGCDKAGPPPPAGAWWPEYALGLARRARLVG